MEMASVRKLLISVDSVCRIAEGEGGEWDGRRAERADSKNAFSVGVVGGGVGVGGGDSLFTIGFVRAFFFGFLDEELEVEREVVEELSSNTTRDLLNRPPLPTSGSVSESPTQPNHSTANF